MRKFNQKSLLEAASSFRAHIRMAKDFYEKVEKIKSEEQEQFAILWAHKMANLILGDE